MNTIEYKAMFSNKSKDENVPMLQAIGYIFADEPTGRLDSANGEAVMKLLKETKRENKTTMVLDP